jgi:hypothetical protein
MTSTLYIKSGTILYLNDDTNLKVAQAKVEIGGHIRNVNDADDCTITGDLDNEGIVGHIGHSGTPTVTGTVSGCGEYLGGWEDIEPTTCGTSSAMGDEAWVTNEGMKVVTHRLLSNLFNGNKLYSGKISKLRIYYDSDDDDVADGYFDAPLNISHIETSDNPIPWSFGSSTDLETELTYDTITIDLNFIIPESKIGYDISTGIPELISADIDVRKLEILNEKNVVMVKTNEPTTDMFAMEYEKRYTFEWEFIIGNDTAPPEWSNHSRSSFTQFGLFLTGHRLLYDENNSPITAPPSGVYLNSYQEEHGISQEDDDVETFFYDDSASSWNYVGSLVATIQNDDKLQFMATKKFSAIYIKRAITTGTFSINVQYYDGSSWKSLPSYSDGTQNFSRDGYFEFHMPWDWDTYTQTSPATFTGYAIRFTVITTATATAGLYGGTGSLIYLSDHNTKNNEPSNILNQNPIGNRIIDENSSKALIASRFTSSDIGKTYDDDGYLIGIGSKTVNGMSLSSVDAIKEKIVTPVSVTISSGDVNSSYVKIANTNPRPDVVMVLYDTTNGDCVKLGNNTYDVYELGGYYYVKGYLNLDSTHGYKIWYLPKTIDMSSEDVKDIRKVYAPSQNRSLPSQIHEGLLRKDWSVSTPAEVLGMMTGNETKDLFSPNQRITSWKTKDYSALENIGFNLSLLTLPGALTLATDRIVGALGYDNLNIQLRPWGKSQKTTYLPSETVMSPGEDSLENQKRVIDTSNGSYIYSFNSTDKFPAIFMEFNNPGEGQDLTLQMSLSMQSSLHATGADVFVWDYINDRWKPISRFDITYGDYRTEMKDISITTDGNIFGSSIFILVISQIPQFSKATGLMVKSNVSDEKLDETFNNIYDTYNDIESGEGSKDIASFADIDQCNIKLDSFYARIISNGDSSGSLSRLVRGVDYTWDEDNDEIELLNIDDILSAEQKYLKRMTGMRYELSPSIGWATERFVDIGKLGSSNGKWNNDDDIEDDITSGSFNFEFALSKIPYCIRNGIYAKYVYGQDHQIPPQNITISYQDDYEFTTENDYRDNHIKRHENGHGCYVAKIAVSDAITYSNITDEDVIYVEISYPYIKTNYYKVEYLEDVDYGIVGRSYRSEDTFGTPIKLSNRDELYPSFQIYSTWPRGKEPDTVI